MFGRNTTLVGRVLAAVALFTLLTGASEEAGGVIIHVELAQAEHPAPEGHDSWSGVIPSDATGPHYFWRPSGWVLVQRTDGTVVRARNDFQSAGNDARVSLLQSRTGRWFVTSVERRGNGELYEPTDPGPMQPDTLLTEEGETIAEEEGWTFERGGS